MRSTGALIDAALVGLARALVSIACWASGFRAISDDDYSRLVIAGGFAHAPSLDPSGTSWLPLPFWLYGVPMALLGDSLTVARGVAFVLGVLSAILVWVSARVLGLSGRPALVAGLAAALLPYGAWLSIATVPEAPCAALVLFGVVCLARTEARLRFWGGLALGAACFCRYEAWAPAVAFALCTGWQAWKARRRELWPGMLLATLPIAAWLLHGVVRHDSALFFVKRVTAYRAALGAGEQGGWLQAVIDVPWALVRFEPELIAVLGVTLALSLGKGRSPFSREALGTAIGLLALFVFLIAAQASGGSATHHPERSLLPVFWFLALLTVGLMSKLAEKPRAWRVPVLSLPLALAASLLLRPDVRSTFVDRNEEERLGSLLRGLGAEQVALDTDDFGFFALQAALGHGKSFPLVDLDPRSPKGTRPSSTTELESALRQHRALWLVTTRPRQPLAAPLGITRAATTRLALLELRP